MRVLLGVSGGITAYKALEFTRLAMKAGHAVRVIETEAATRFVGPASFAGITGAPVLITEWFFAAKENRSGNTNNGHLMTVATQAERARGAAAATRNFASLPEVIGSQWFQYYDHPKIGRADGENYDFGLVDLDNRPYRKLTNALQAANRDAPAVHAAAKQPSPHVDAPFLVPHAAIAYSVLPFDGSNARLPVLLPRLHPIPAA